MRPLFRTLLAVTLMTMPVIAAAQTLTVRDLVALSQAGLGDEVLIALIDADKAVFQLGPYDVLDLRKQGLSDAVLVHMIETGISRTTPALLPVRDRPVGNQDPAPRSARDVAPVVVTQTVRQEVRVETPEPRYVQVPVYVPIQVRPREPEKVPEPVYWGFGGQRRPDSWKDNRDVPKKPGGGSEK